MDEYKIKTVEEGLTKIQFPEFDKISSDAPVFYNPHMELNRDISILALQTFQKQEDRNINICDLFGGSGIRGVRYKNEIDGVGHVFINDISETANEYERHNVELNNLKDMDRINEIADKHGLKVIEDAAQAHGAMYKGKNVGALGDAGCFSFYPTKNMTTSEGGIITTDDEELAKRARIFRAHGSSIKYTHDEIGYNFRMTDISAAIGLAQLNVIDGFNDKRIANAEYLNEGLKDVDGVVTPYSADDFKHVYHQYTILVEKGKRDDWVDFLTQKGIGTGVHYPIPLYNQPIYKKLGIEGSAPDAELAANHVISLPVHPSLTQEDLDLVIDAVKQASDSFN